MVVLFSLIIQVEPPPGDKTLLSPQSLDMAADSNVARESGFSSTATTPSLGDPLTEDQESVADSAAPYIQVSLNQSTGSSHMF